MSETLNTKTKFQSPLKVCPGSRRTKLGRATPEVTPVEMGALATSLDFVKLLPMKRELYRDLFEVTSKKAEKNRCLYLDQT